MPDLPVEDPRRALLRRTRAWMVFYAAALVASALTAVPVEWELRTILSAGWAGAAPGTSWWPAMHTFLARVLEAVRDVGARHPFLFYGYDWLAFGIGVLGILFLGAARDPARNVWVVHFGLICCALVLAFAAIVPHLRGLPWFWTFVDGSFGIAGAVPLLLVLRDLRRLESPAAAPAAPSGRVP